WIVEQGGCTTEEVEADAESGLENGEGAATPPALRQCVAGKKDMTRLLGTAVDRVIDVVEIFRVRCAGRIEDDARGLQRLTRHSSQGARERIALAQVAALEAAAEPAHALLGAAVGEALRRDAALGLFLQAIVADRRGRRQRRFEVALLEDLAAAVRMMRPDAGEAVGLQLHAHRE